jgi:hypothetical protein
VPSGSEGAGKNSKVAAKNQLHILLTGPLRVSTDKICTKLLQISSPTTVLEFCHIGIEFCHIGISGTDHIVMTKKVNKI